MEKTFNVTGICYPEENYKENIHMKTLIFDLGMVLVHFRWRDFLTDMGYEGEKKEGLARAMFKNPLWTEFDRGVMGDENVIAQMKLEAPQYEEDIARIWQKENFTNICHPFDYSEELIRTLHAMGFKIYVLSNYGRTLLGLNREKYTFLNYVDGGVFSWEVNLLKPDDAIYQALIEKYGIDPGNAVFFDDVEANCEGARRAGITAVQVSDGLRSILDGLREECGIELPAMEKYLKD